MTFESFCTRPTGYDDDSVPALPSPLSRETLHSCFPPLVGAFFSQPRAATVVLFSLFSDFLKQRRSACCGDLRSLPVNFDKPLAATLHLTSLWPYHMKE
ncbi:hypothetical protein TNCV_260901 [Trichonephila clavipes]|nr:hypothetical protein TNCV_260901 [Trichonephila clavipes]